MPLTIDPTGVYFRHEGDQVLTGFSDDVKPGLILHGSARHLIICGLSWRTEFQISKGSNWNRVGPDYTTHNTADQNAIIGEHPLMKGYFVALGFSGHGMQQAPGVGLGLAELICKGKYETLDLTPLRVETICRK